MYIGRTETQKKHASAQNLLTSRAPSFPLWKPLKQCLSLKLLKHWAHHERIFSQQIFSICMYHDGDHFKCWNDLNSSNQSFHSRGTFPLFKSHLVYDAEHLALYSNDLIVIFCRWLGNNKRQCCRWQTKFSH